MAQGIVPTSEGAASVISDTDVHAPHPLKIGTFRWRICALLFIANTINYMDRQVLSFLAPMLQTRIGWNEVQYGYIVVAFQLAYALGLLSVGGIIDTIGVRLGYALSNRPLEPRFDEPRTRAFEALAFGTSRFFLGLG